MLCHYEIYDEEMLAIVRTLGHWPAELMGLQTQLHTVYTRTTAHSSIL